MMSTNEKMGYMPVDAKEAEELPAPVSIRSDSQQRLRTARRFLLFSMITFLAVWSFRSTQGRHHYKYAISPNRLNGTADPVEGYWRGIATKGMRKAVGSVQASQHGKHHKDHKHKNKHDHDHPHHLPPHHEPPHHPPPHHEPPHHPHHPSPHHPDHPPPSHHPIFPKQAEDIFLSVPNNDSARAALLRYTRNAHPAGSGFDLALALAVKNEWETALGLPSSGPEEHLYEAGSAESQARIHNGMGKMGVWMDTYFPIMNTPVHASVKLMTDPPFHAKLREDILEGDPDSVHRDDVPVFHGLSVSGDVKGQYIYVGYGRKDDFDILQAKGIDFSGKIVIVKYGGNFRGLKIKAAQEAGAIGVIIFTDPGDDGEITEANGYEQYPNGPARQESSVQRGSVQFISAYPGDPSTPGEPAYKNATRVPGGNQPSIPSLPMSYQDVIPILKALEGKGIAASELGAHWTGGLGFYGVDYFTGPSEVELHMVNEVNTHVMPIWNVMATIPGHITDEVVICGNHRDAWVLGAVDPNSGTASQHEVIRGVGALLAKGWKPLRTIVFASWDAEEYGLIGSTEWTEDFASFLVKDAAAYINMDESASGSKFAVAASPSLSWLIRSAAQDVLSGANASRSVWDSRGDDGDWQDRRMKIQGDEDRDYEDMVRNELNIRPLGSGSDFTSFLQRYGVASGNMQFDGAPGDPTYHYHSIYDSFTYMDKFLDPGFHKHVDAAKVLGLTMLRLADSLVLPLNTTQYSIELKSYLHKVEAIAGDLDMASSVNFTMLSESIDSLIASSTQLDSQKQAALRKLRKLLPKPKSSLMQKLSHKWRRFQAGCGSHSARKHLEQMELWDDQTMFDMPRGGHPPFPFPALPKKMKEIAAVLKEIRGINQKVRGFEGGFISEEGIKDRTWYKHKGVAPGAWLGYGATTFPSVTEAMTIDKSPELAQKEADLLAGLIHAMAERLSA